jgi:ketosteroid isomerase-like protein
MDHAAVQQWLDRYIGAWRSYDRSAIGDLFTEDAEYRYHPWDEPVRGRDAIVSSWTEDQDDPSAWDATYAPFAVEGDRAVATGVSRYADGDGKREYHNVFLLAFAPDGRARSFTEVYAQRRS